MKYRIADSSGRLLRQRFSSWTKADNFRHLMGRPDWKVIECCPDEARAEYG